MTARAATLCDFWYAIELVGVVDDFEAVVRRAAPRGAGLWLGNRWLRCLAFLWFARQYQLAIPNWYTYGRLFCILNAMSLRRPVALLECIDYDIDGQPAPVRIMYRLFCRWLLGPALRATTVLIHVMTEWERGAFARRYRLPIDRMTFVPWPLSSSTGESPLDVTKAMPPSVFASGRAACDWGTLFEAQRLGGWPLAVACAPRDLAAVRSLNLAGEVQVACDVTREEHDRMLGESSVYVVSLLEQNKSSGQARLGDAIASRVPSVVTAVRGLEGYLEDGVTGLAVPAANPTAMALAVTQLLADPAARRELADCAATHVSRWSDVDYFAELSALLRRYVR